MVDAVLAAVEGWRRDPFGSVVGLAFSGGPAGGGVVDESVVAAAGQGEFVDVGVAAVLPVALGVVDLAAVWWGGAVGFGAAAFQGVQGQALARAGGAAGASVVELDLSGIVEQREVGVGPAGGGHPDESGDGQLGAAAGVGQPGGGGEFGQGGGGHDGDGKPVVLAQGPGGQHGPAHGLQCVVAALGGAAGVGVDLVLCGDAVEARGLVLGVAVSGCGQFGERRIQGGAQFGSDPAGEPAHAVQALSPEGQAAFAGVLAFVVEGAVGVEVAQQLAGEFAQPFRGQSAGEPAELGFGGRSGARVEIGR